MTLEKPILFSSKEYADLAMILKKDEITDIYVTNGAYASQDPKAIAEFGDTTNAGFQYLIDTVLQNNLPDVKSAFLIAVHGKEGMVKDYSADPAKVDSDLERAERVVPAVRAHFAPLGIPVYGVVFDDISAVTAEHFLHNSGFDLVAAFKFGNWGNADNKFCVFEKNFEKVLLYPYSNQDKTPYMLNKGPWDGREDSRTPYRHQAGVAFYHVSPDSDPQTKPLEIVDLFSDQNPMGKRYLGPDNRLV